MLCRQHRWCSKQPPSPLYAALQGPHQLRTAAAGQALQLHVSRRAGRSRLPLQPAARPPAPTPAPTRRACCRLLALFGASALLEFALVGVGLRGGPMEPRKRGAMVPLVYIEVLLWVLLLAFTGAAAQAGSGSGLGWRAEGIRPLPAGPTHSSTVR